MNMLFITLSPDLLQNNSRKLINSLYTDCTGRSVDPADEISNFYDDSYFLIL